MLPSTGYFNGVRCYFYDGGSCDRPYCHFKHSKKGRAKSEDLDSALAAIKVVVGKVGGIEDPETLAARIIADLNKLPTEALPAPPPATNATSATYSPTPLAQLRQMQTTVESLKPTTRHIPIPYAPTRPPSLRPRLQLPDFRNLRPLYQPLTSIPNPNATTNAGNKPEDKEQSPTKSSHQADQYIPSAISSSVTASWNAKTFGNVSVTQATAKTGQTTSTACNEYTPSYAPTYSSSLPGVKSDHLQYVPTMLCSSRSPSPTTNAYTPDKCNKTQQYVPTASGTAASTSNTQNHTNTHPTLAADLKIKYHPTDIKAIKSNNNVEYSPTITTTDQSNPSISYQPTIQKNSTKDHPDLLDDLSTEFDFISEIIDDVNLQEATAQLKQNNATETPTDTPKSKISRPHTSGSKHEKSKSSSSKTQQSSTSSSTGASLKRDSKSSSSSTAKKDHKSSPASQRHRSNSSSKTNGSLSNKNSSNKTSSKHSSSNKSSSSGHKSSTSKKSSPPPSLTNKTKNSKPSKRSSSRHSYEKSSHRSSQSKRSSHHSESSSRSKKSSSNREVSTKHEVDKSTSKDKLSEMRKSFVLPALECSLSSDDDIEAQCRRIFEGCDAEPKAAPIGQAKITAEQPVPDVESQKKRVAHSNIIPMSRVPKTTKPNFAALSSQMLVDRYKLADQKARNIEQLSQNENIVQGKEKKSFSFQEYRLLKRPAVIPVIPSTSTSMPKKPLIESSKTSGRVRIAHVPNVPSLLAAEKTLKIAPSTIPQTIAKGKSRVAHIPTKKPVLADRPTVRDAANTKIPVHVRTVFLNNMIDACLDMYHSADAACERGRNEEHKVFDKCKSLTVYKHSALLAVHRLKNEVKAGIKDEPSSSSNLIQDTAPRRVERRFSATRNMYESLFEYILTSEQLETYGYPRPNFESDDRGAAVIMRPATSTTTSKPIDPYEKTCARCHKMYRVTVQGFAAVPDECLYHPNRHYRFRGELKYACCGSGVESDGCCTANSHVFDDVNYDNLRGFVETLDGDDWDPVIDPSVDFGIFALDCEMSYTTGGMELTRITVIDRNCDTIYETLVKPFHPVIDYNTRFSGITADKMEGVTTTLLDVQANLLHLFNSRSILIGHSLDSDLKALKLIHDVVIDTSILFPHRLGLPYRRALRNLASDFLHKIIQNDVTGHDSAEDAITCMELVIYKLHQDMKV